MKKVKYGMVIDLRRCIGCQTCEVACKMENDVPISVWQSWVKKVSKGVYPRVSKAFLPILCNHCENAVCVTVCPTKASFKREDGIVEVDPHKCIGCQYCMAACPYAVRFLHPVFQIVRKCNYCSQRVDNGLEPACVDACPVNARIFGDLNDPESEVSILKATHPVQSLKPDAGTEPNVFYIGLDEAAVTTIKE